MSENKTVFRPAIWRHDDCIIIIGRYIINNCLYVYWRFAMQEMPECTVFHKKNVEKVLQEMSDDLTLARMAEIFQCFADPTRLKIINALLLSDLCVCDLTKIMNMTQPAVSHHLKHLRQIHLVKASRSGKSILYSLDDYHVQLLFDVCRSHLNETIDKTEEE